MAKVRLKEDYYGFPTLSRPYLKGEETEVWDSFPWADHYIRLIGEKIEGQQQLADLIHKNVCEVIE